MRRRLDRLYVLLVNVVLKSVFLIVLQYRNAELVNRIKLAFTYFSVTNKPRSYHVDKRTARYKFNFVNFVKSRSVQWNMKSNSLSIYFLSILQPWAYLYFFLCMYSNVFFKHKFHKIWYPEFFFWQKGKLYLFCSI